jgi:hypothetical protein
MNAAIINDINYCKRGTVGQFVVNATIAAGPTQFSTTQLEFRYAIVTALKTLAGGANTGVVKIGPSANVSEQPIALNPGDSYALPTAPGAKFDFRDWYFAVATNADGLVVQYI